jgi:hypothetical protein
MHRELVSTVRRWSSVHDFLGAARAFLAAREAEHCLLFGIAAAIADHPDVYREPRLWTVHEGERVVGAALRTPPHNLILSQLDEPRWLAALTEDVLASDEPPGVLALTEDVLASDEPPGVLGPTAAARTLADTWAARTGRAAVRLLQERIFRLDRVIPPRLAPGRCREAEEPDRALLAAWWQAFSAEALPEAPPGDAAEAADRLLRRVGRVAYLWEDAGEVVALAGAGGPTPRGIRSARSTRHPTGAAAATRATWSPR